MPVIPAFYRHFTSPKPPKTTSARSYGLKRFSLSSRKLKRPIPSSSELASPSGPYSPGHDPYPIPFSNLGYATLGGADEMDDFGGYEGNKRGNGEKVVVVPKIESAEKVVGRAL